MKQRPDRERVDERAEAARKFMHDFPTLRERQTEVSRKYTSGLPVSDIEAHLADDGPAGEHPVTSSFDYGDGTGPGVLTFSVDFEGYLVDVSYTLTDQGDAAWVDTRIRPNSSTAVPSGNALKRFGLAEVETQLQGELHRPSTLWGLPRQWAEAQLSPTRRGQRRTPDWKYAVWAWRYVQAFKRNRDHPMDEMVERYGDLYSRASMYASVNRATKRGLKTEPPKGRPGGELTPKCHRILSTVPPHLLEEG